MVDKGATSIQTARYYNLPVSTVRSTVNLDVLCNEGVLQLRSGASKSYIEAEERWILRYVRSNSKDIYAEVIIACLLDFGKNIIKKILKAYGIYNWKAKWRLFLMQKYADQ